jgi:hypothetical protein
MATWSTVSRLARALPLTEESATKEGLRQWRVKGKLLAWERPLRRSDLVALGESAPKGAILGVFVPDLETKDVLVTSRGEIYFTTPHFKGYAIVLVRLREIRAGELKELLEEGWRVRAPKPRKRRS